MVGGRSRPAAVENPHRPSVPETVSEKRPRSARADSHSADIASTWPSSEAAAGVSLTLSPCYSSRGTPSSADSCLTWGDTVDGEYLSAWAAAVTVPWRWIMLNMVSRLSIMRSYRMVVYLFLR